MASLTDRDQPVAGPSSRPHTTPSPPPIALALPPLDACLQSEQCHLDPVFSSWPIPTHTARHPRHNNYRRQDPASSSSSTTADSSPDSSSSSSSSTSPSLFAGPTENVSGLAIPTGGDPSSSVPYSPSPTTSPTSTSPFPRPWKTSTRSSSQASPSETPFVPGVLLPLTLGGDSDDQAVYSVEMVFGHDAPGDSDTSDSRRWMRRKSSSAEWNGGDPQTVNLQVDLGSADMWIASADCSTSDCDDAPLLFNASQSLDANTNMDFSFQSGQVGGEVYWEQVELGGFGIGYQAFLAADEVSNENLGGGNFTGVLGLAPPANSVILSKIAGSTSGNPDGATFLDNLFGGGASAPTQRLFSLSLARREDTRTSSSFGIGAVSSSLCPDPCSPKYMPIIPKASLGPTGYVYWRLALDAITVTTWSDQAKGQGASEQSITLGSSQIDSSKSTPMAVLDSGGVSILSGYKPWIDAIYTAMGVNSVSSDGNYRMPCTSQLALSFTFAGQVFPVHPLDLSWPDPNDPSQATCIGAIQYASNLGDSGDFVLGSAFLKNVYSIFQYPDYNRTDASSWQPTIGLISLTNSSVASQDFYAVRVQHQSLSSVSSAHPSGVGNSATTSSPPVGGVTSGHRAVSTAIIAGVSVVGFFVLAAAAFCAWWFWLRRKFGASGQVEYTATSTRPHSSGHKSEGSTASMRTRKHDTTLRQKSMVEGFSDFEADSWMSTTEGDSIRLGYLPEVIEEDEERQSRVAEGSSRGSSVREKSAGANREVEDLIALDSATATPTSAAVAPIAPPPSSRRSGRGASPSATRSLALLPEDDFSPTRTTSAYPYPTSPTSTARSLSFNMAGPFPSASRQSLMRPDTSPMYDIRTSDYLTVGPGNNPPRGRKSHRFSSTNVDQREVDGGTARAASPRRSPGVLDGPTVEEPTELNAEQK